MILVIFISCIITGGLLGFVITPAAGRVLGLAKIYTLGALVISLSYWFLFFSGIKNAAFMAGLSMVLQAGSLLGFLVLGYLVINIAKKLKTATTADDKLLLQKLTRATLWGISIITGNTFIITTFGKARHLAEMLDFFKTSGYAAWFLYFIMTIEPLGGLGILLHFKLKTGVLATIGLMLIMIGAVYTHWHNNDPFSDSYAAVTQLIILSLMLVLYYFEKKANTKPGGAYPPIAIDTP